MCGRAGDTAVSIPVGVRWATALVGLGIPNLSVVAANAADSIPVGTLSTDTSVSLNVQDLTIAAGRDLSADSLEEDASWSTTALVDQAIPDESVGTSGAGRSSPE